MTAFQQQLKALIRENGPIGVDTFMSLAIGHYYATRDPFGTKGDFTTAPEISQMFGEMIGVFFADAWIKMGSPSPVLLVEAGPGRGTLMADLLRATKHVPGFHQAVKVHLIEISPVLKEKQTVALQGFDVVWHETLDDVTDGPILFIGNEFLDALPVRQYQFSDAAWHERRIGLQKEDLVFGLAEEKTHHPDLPSGEELKIFEQSPARENFVQNLAQRIQQQQGVALLIDYGHDISGYGDTLQAVKNHAFVDVLSDAGEADLTSHVDFEAVKKAARPYVSIFGPAGQGDFLKALGIDLRAVRLGKQGNALRLTADHQMGRLFRVMALCHDSGMNLCGLGRNDD